MQAQGIVLFGFVIRIAILGLSRGGEGQTESGKRYDGGFSHGVYFVRNSSDIQYQQVFEPVLSDNSRSLLPDFQPLTQCEPISFAATAKRTTHID